jgi:hypothetical protein
LGNTPVDVVYTYVDLTDKNLVQDGITRMAREYENGELKFSLRSVLQNIPWVRKIFIIMPNEKVSFLKDPQEIEDRIVYTKDKDLLGFDCASSITIEQNGLAELDKFGVSEHFIYMNDDYFIGKPLSKSDFFYEENGIVKPYILADKNSFSQDMFDNVMKEYRTTKKP